jgi:hypothetical protein
VFRAAVEGCQCPTPLKVERLKKVAAAYLSYLQSCSILDDLQYLGSSTIGMIGPSSQSQRLIGWHRSQCSRRVTRGFGWENVDDWMPLNCRPYPVPYFYFIPSLRKRTQFSSQFDSLR